ncbi:class I SAM-dependent RNA methyltransferase [Bifidobacterium avesanii]|uniref:TRAM domain-containing protein n=1 Tax=Bifidobacterium avesanii TaxID=1798157 RepID=A0A7K3TIC7_9BIFI|nr:RsmD family RNA methyltransferase [Bifidobacterium avesanii]KAB8289904.1 RNA methyltransferase [Bifidobacterium avesanii]NEG78855.1 TRAM domain-containing protein [Bifidobacterium avesanii]
MDAQVRIERYADQGRCVAHIDGRVVFVRFALPGELVRITLDEPHDRDDRFWTGEVAEVVEPSPDRVDPAWPLAGPLAMGGGVGGADLVHVSLEGQLKWKAATIGEQLRRLGHVDPESVGGVTVERMSGDEELGGLNWRTRIELIADEDGYASMRRRGSHTRVRLDGMPLATKRLLEIAEREHVWDGGFTPGAQIRLVAPEPRGDAATGRDGNFAVLVGGEIAAGSADVEERMSVDGHDFRYEVASSGFWQIHREAPMRLPAYVMSLVRASLDGAESAVLWDLYSGSGLFSLPMAALAAPRTRMLTVEGAPEAVHHARRNLRAAGFDAVDARCGDVHATLQHVPHDLESPDVVVLDPPRAGARAKVCRRVAAANPAAVVYVACDPTSLARDTATFVSLGYGLASVRAFDIYPMTHHVETVALFRRTRA